MNAQERQLVDDLFDRLSKLENAPRDPDGVAAIREGLSRAPNAVYALVQTVLVQDEAMKQAHAHIEDLESRVAEPSTQGGFLDSMRGALFGQQQGGGSVPSVRPAEQRPVWNSGQVIDQRYQQDPAPMGGTPAAGMPSGGAGSGGGSFLGTAAAAAAGMIGGSLLMNSFRGMMGGGHNQAFGDGGSGKDSRSPFGTDQSGGDLARDAGLNDIGGGGRHADADNPRQGLFDQASLDDDDSDDDFDSDDFDSGDSDTA